MAEYTPHARHTVPTQKLALYLCCFALVALSLPEIGLGQIRRLRQRAAPLSRSVANQVQAEPLSQNRIAGQCVGQIYRFDPVTDKDDDPIETVGTLRIRPAEKGARTLKLLIPDDGKARASVAGHKIDLFDEHRELLGMQLYCHVSWTPVPQEEEAHSSKRPPMMLQSLTLETMEVTGEIKEVDGDDLLVMRADPLNGELWPGMTVHPTQKKGTQGTPPRVPSRKLKIHILPEVTQFVDADRKPLSAWDWELEPSQKVEAVIAYGRKGSILVELRRLPDQTSEAEYQHTARRDR